MTLSTPPATQENGLVDQLRNNSSEVISWIDQAPLKLVGVTLVDLGGSGDAKKLATRLETVFKNSEANWDSWWKKVRPALKDSDYFSFGKSNLIRLASPAEDIPVEPLKTSSTWNQWYKATHWPLSGKGMLPKGAPQHKIISDLAGSTEHIIERLLPRSLDTIEEFLNLPGKTVQSAQNLLELLWAGLSRYQVFREPELNYAIYLRGYRAQHQLLQFLQQDGRDGAMVQAAQKAIGNPARRKVLAAGLWHSGQDNRAQTRRQLELLAKRLAKPELITLWDEIGLAAFTPRSFEDRTEDLDWIWSLLDETARSNARRRLILRAALGEAATDDLSHFALESRHGGKLANRANRLAVVSTAALLLSGGQDGLIDQAAEDFGATLENSAAPSNNPLISALLEVANKLIEQKNQELIDERKSHEEQLEGVRSEWHKQVQGLRELIAANREESRFAIRRDMLEVMAETLKTLQLKQSSPPENLLRDVKAGLEIALQAGGVEWYGKPGELVEYDPRLHDGRDVTLKGAPVAVTSRGALVPGKATGDFVLFKAQVSPQPEVK